MLDRVSKEKTL